MHILHVIDSLRLGGAERMLVDIANATLADGHRVSACITREGRDLANDLKPEIQLWVLARQKRFDFAAMKQFASIVKEQKVDVIHAHSRPPFSFVAFVKTLGLIQTPVLLHDHHGTIEFDAAVPVWFRWWGRHFVARYVGVYQKLADWAVTAGVPKEKTAAIGNALDLSRVQAAEPAPLRREFGVSADEKLGLVVAGIRPEKGIVELLEAMARTYGRHAVRIIVVGGERGGGYLGVCKAKCFSLGLDGTVLFAGERADVPSLIRGADFAIVPSLSESGPLVLIEYLAAGLPVVATRVGDIAHRAAAAGVTEFVPPGDVTALANGIDRLLSLSPEAWQERAKVGRAIASAQFEIRQAMPRWYRMYREAMGRSSS